MIKSRYSLKSNLSVLPLQWACTLAHLSEPSVKLLGFLRSDLAWLSCIRCLVCSSSCAPLAAPFSRRRRGCTSSVTSFALRLSGAGGSSTANGIRQGAGSSKRRSWGSGPAASGGEPGTAIEPALPPLCLRSFLPNLCNL